MKPLLDEATFLRHVADHTMRVQLDKGTYRHLEFRDGDSGHLWFDLISFADRLVITGDMGTYVFSRCEDMFDFFRIVRYDISFNRNATVQINEHYWSEKLIASDTHFHHQEFSKEVFEAALRDRFETFFDNEIDEDEYRDPLEDEEAEIFEDDHEVVVMGYADSAIDERPTREELKAQIWAEVESDVLSCEENEAAAISAAERFEWQGKHPFTDFWETRLTRFTYQYLWCLCAISWGIAQYDKMRFEAHLEIQFNTMPSRVAYDALRSYNWWEMTTAERAEKLLALGVTARQAGERYVAEAFHQRLPVGEFDQADAAVAAGIAWLKTKKE